MDIIGVVVIVLILGVPFFGACITLYLIGFVNKKSDIVIKKLDYITKHLIEDKP